MEKLNNIALSAFVLTTIISCAKCLAPGYSFAKFMGPVSGPEHKITVFDNGHYHQHDYVAKPDYHFEYGVEDPKTNVHQSRQETRDGDTVHDPDGKLRTVRYTADKKNGFHASILTDGHVVNHPQDPVAPVYNQQIPQVPLHGVGVPVHPGNGGGDDGGGGGDDGGGGGDGGGDEAEYEGDDEGGDENEEYTDTSGGDGSGPTNESQEEEEEEDEYY